MGHIFKWWVRVKNIWSRLDQFFVARVRSAIYGLREKNLFGSGQKLPGSKAGQPLNYCGSKVSSGQVRSQGPSLINLHSYLSLICCLNNFFMIGLFISVFIHNALIGYQWESKYTHLAMTGYKHLRNGAHT